MVANGIRHQTQAGTVLWDGVKDYALDHWVLDGYKAIHNGTDTMATKVQEALQFLLFDLRAKLSKKRKDASQTKKVLGLPSSANDRFRAATAANHTQVAFPGQSFLPTLGGAVPTFPAPSELAFVPRGVIVYMTDPEAIPGTPCGAIPVLERQWGGRGVLGYVGMIYEPTMEHLVLLAL
jgi:hypothetical protein